MNVGGGLGGGGGREEGLVDARHEQLGGGAAWFEIGGLSGMWMGG